MRCMRPSRGYERISDLRQCAGFNTCGRSPPELAAFLGRWEGYNYSPPVKKDWKFVLVIQEITAQGGKALFAWAGHQSSISRLGQGDPLQGCHGGYTCHRVGILLAEGKRTITAHL